MNFIHRLRATNKRSRERGLAPARDNEPRARHPKRAPAKKKKRRK